MADSTLSIEFFIYVLDLFGTMAFVVTGAFKAIEKIARGLASHPDVANALRRANEELEEAFTRKDFEKLEADNEHTEAAEKLINMFGTKEEKFAMAAIKARHNMTGYINGKDYSKRQMMVKKYYSRLK